MTPNSNGGWTESVIHYFHTRAIPVASLTLDAAGNLYGTTPAGGFAGHGQVFKLAPQSGGGWAFSVLHSFYAKPAYDPRSSLVFDGAGNLYGTTEVCAFSGCHGVVYEVIP